MKFPGDVGYVDQEGFVYLVDRQKELIKVNGLQVAPAELEALLLTHPEVQDAAIIGIPDEKQGEVPKAYIVKKNPKLTAQEVMEFVKGKKFFAIFSVFYKIF